MLELKDIKKSYKVGEKKQLVLKGINIKFRNSEFTSILGSSGSGKTTLLNLIGGLDRYDSGELIIDSISTKKYNDSDWDSYRNYRVGFIFQSYNLIMHQSVLSNVEIALTLSGVSKKERRQKAIDALIRVGLEEHINKRPNQLSGGQMQRVAIARALVNDPEIILADEPTGALDSVTSVQIMDLLKSIAKDKLVIMVTHNPELAKKYSTRIIELKDGEIISDSNPYKEKKEKINNKKINKTSMSLLTALSLSFNNLKTKMGRTILTAIAGSIGIIGIALILSLSNGVNNYAKKLERDSLTDFPITIEKVNYDLFGALAEELTISNEKCDDNKLCSRDDIIKNSNNSDKGFERKNNIKEFIKYINNSDIKNYTKDIKYKYNIELQVYNKDYTKVNPTKYGTKEEKNIFEEMDFNDNNFEVLAGTKPNNYNEIVLVVNSNNEINDSILYALGIKDSSKINDDIQKKLQDEKYKVESKKYSFDDILNKTYKLILNTDYYKEENDAYIDYSNNIDYMKGIIDKGLELKLVGIIRSKNDSNSLIGYTSDLTKYVIDQISKTNIYAKQLNNKKINVINNQEFDGIINTYDSVVNKLGIYEYDDPSSISFYPKDYNSKEQIVKIIDKYNEEKKNNNQSDLVIKYSDVMKSLVGGISQVVNIISFVLIGFIAISLIVSSIMIGIITYISVLERTKEIGILRAIGASKKDIKRVFRSETIIEGFIAGALGIFVAVVLSSIISSIVSLLAKVDNIASVPVLGAIILILLSVGLNVIAGALPSSVAAKKDPVESLRTE